MSLCKAIPCTCGKCKLITCGCGTKIVYEESACSPACYTKIKTPIQPAKVDVTLKIAIHKMYAKVEHSDSDCVIAMHENLGKILWGWMSPNQRESALKEIESETVS